MISLRDVLPLKLQRHKHLLAAVLEVFLWLLAAIALLGQADLVLYALVALLAWTGSPLRALQMLLVQFLLLHFNPNLTGWGGSGGIHLITPAGMLIRVMCNPDQRRDFFADPTLAALLASAPLFAGYQFVFSTYPMLSLSKAALFFIYVPLVLYLTKWGFRRDRGRICQWYLGVTIFLVVASVFMLKTPDGYYRNEVGFNGILLHPNALGMILGLGLSYLMVRVWNARKISWPLAVAALVGVVEIYLSQSRGGLLTCLLAVGIALAWKSLAGRNSERIGGRAAVIAAILVVLMVVNFSRVQDAVADFLVKSGDSAAQVGAVFKQSRGAAIDLHMDLFKGKPWTGHGFQIVNAWTNDGFDFVKSDSSGLINESLINYDPLTGKIPISAPVESGFTYTSILAENGIIGGVFIYGVLIMVFIPIFKGPKYPEFVLAIAALLSNLTEATIFSVSGVGGWSWMMIALAYASATVPRNPKSAAKKRHPRRLRKSPRKEEVEAVPKVSPHN